MSAREIEVVYRAVDGYRTRRKFSTLGGAQRFAQKMLGPTPSIGTRQAVSDDGIGVLFAFGASLGELFPLTVEAPIPTGDPGLPINEQQRGYL